MAEKVARILYSRGLSRDKHDRRAQIASVRKGADGCLTALQRASIPTASATLGTGPARLGRAALADALGDIAVAREAAKVPVKKAVRHRTRGDNAERQP